MGKKYFIIIISEIVTLKTEFFTREKKTPQNVNVENSYFFLNVKVTYLRLRDIDL